MEGAQGHTVNLGLGKMLLENTVIKCIQNTQTDIGHYYEKHEFNLTEGKKYTVTSDFGSGKFCLMDDIGEQGWYYKEWFKIVGILEIFNKERV